MTIKQRQVREARRGEQPIIENLLQLYLYEFSAALGTDVEADGRFLWDGLDDYWAEDGLHPFLLTVDDKLAGFALVQRISGADQTLVWDMEDFFVMAKYRRSGLGAFAADHLFRRFPGRWQIRVSTSNSGARAFWYSTLATSQMDSEPPAAVTVDGRAFEVFRFRT